MAKLGMECEDLLLGQGLLWRLRLWLATLECKYLLLGEGSRVRLCYRLRTEICPQLLTRLGARLLLLILLLLNESDEVKLGEFWLRDEACFLLGSHSELGHFNSSNFL